MCSRACGVHVLRRCASGVTVRPDEGRHHQGSADRGRLPRTPSSCVLRAIMTSGSRPAGPTERRPRARSSDRSATCVRTSSTVGPSRRHDLNHQATGSIMWQRAHAWHAEGAARCFEHERDVLKPLASRPYRSFVLPPEARSKAALPRRSAASAAVTRARRSMKAAARRAATGLGPARRSDARCARSPRRGPYPGRWRWRDGLGGHRATHGCPDQSAQQPAASGRDALQQATGHQNARTSTSASTLDEREQIDSQNSASWRVRRTIFLGPPGVGKTIWPSLAIAAAQRPRVYYGALADLIRRGKAAGRLSHRSRTYCSWSSTRSYLPVNQTGAMLFFQLINRRYENRAHVQQGLGVGRDPGRPWPQHSSTGCDHCHIGGNSYRMRQPPSSLKCSTRLLRKLFTPAEKERKSKGENDELEARHLPPKCDFSTAITVTFSTGVDTRWPRPRPRFARSPVVGAPSRRMLWRRRSA